MEGAGAALVMVVRVWREPTDGELRARVNWTDVGTGDTASEAVASRAALIQFLDRRIAAFERS